MGDTNNGFVAIYNWARLGDGQHTAIVYDNGVEFGRSTFEVATLGEEFVVGAEGECTIEDFPSVGETAEFRWNQNTQHLELVGEDGPPPPLPPAGDFTVWPESLRQHARTFASLATAIFDAASESTSRSVVAEVWREDYNRLLREAKRVFVGDTTVQELQEIPNPGTYYTGEPGSGGRVGSQGGEWLGRLHETPGCVRGVRKSGGWAVRCGLRVHFQKRCGGGMAGRLQPAAPGGEARVRG